MPWRGSRKVRVANLSCAKFAFWGNGRSVMLLSVFLPCLIEKETSECSLGLLRRDPSGAPAKQNLRYALAMKRTRRRWRRQARFGHSPGEAHKERLAEA